MAINTAYKRRAAAGALLLGSLAIMPLADGTVDTSDRWQATGIFYQASTGIATTSLNIISDVDVEPAHIADQSDSLLIKGNLEVQGLSYLSLPHLMQSDSTDQAIADVTAEQVITFNTDVHSHLIARTTSSRFTISQAGSYLVTFSAVCVGASGKVLAVWLKVNGDNVAETATYYTFKSTGNSAIMTVTFLHHYVEDDYFELWMWGDSTSNKLDTIAAVEYSEGVLPAIPSCPSIIMTCNYIATD